MESQQRCAPHITLSQRWGGSVTPGGLHAGLGGHGEETEGRGKGYFPALPSHPEINPAWQPRGAVHYSPGSVLRAAVDVGPVLEEMSHDAQPASGTGLVQGTITRIVTMVYITDLVFQTIQNHFLEIGEKRKNIHRVICYCRAAARASLRKRGAGGQEAKHRLPTTCPSTPLDTDQPKKKKKKDKREGVQSCVCTGGTTIVRSRQDCSAAPRAPRPVERFSHRRRSPGTCRFPRQGSQLPLLNASTRESRRKVFALTSAFLGAGFCTRNGSTAPVSSVLKRKST